MKLANRLHWMRNKLAPVLLSIWASAVSAQAPLSAIDWLDAVPLIQPPVVKIEPPVTNSAGVPQVDVMPLDTPSVVAVGLLPRHVTGLPDNLWQASETAVLSRLIDDLDVSQHPTIARLLVTLLLAEAAPPEDTGQGFSLLVARIEKLLALGAVDPAEALLDRAGPFTPELFPLWLDIALLTGHEDVACQTLHSAPYLLDDAATRVFCAARQQDWMTAVMALQGAAALGDIDGRTEVLLGAFLDPEMAEQQPSLPPPPQPTPLDFRLYEAIGEPLPTASLPRVFAAIDLGGDAGWKAQLESAERLARVGTISNNRLLGIYSDRKPAASGGIWDRVQAVQALEAALDSGQIEAISNTLLKAWPKLKAAGLEAPFAELFGPRLIKHASTSPAATMAFEAGLLSAEYESAAANLPETMPNRSLLIAVATGQAPPQAHGTLIEMAVQRGFTDVPLPTDLRNMIDSGRLGEAILTAMDLFVSGAQGNFQDLTDALATFRSVGLEQTARRAALSLLLSEEG